jgi:hypothetical protein
MPPELFSLFLLGLFFFMAALVNILDAFIGWLMDIDDQKKDNQEVTK